MGISGQVRGIGPGDDLEASEGMFGKMIAAVRRREGALVIGCKKLSMGTFRLHRRTSHLSE